jgi:hypothetical protein
VLSAELRNQMARASKKILDGDGGSPGGATLGEVCQLSIPIITLCAFFLLMIMVQLLNIVFWWLPFFKICLPIPQRK